MGLIVLIGLTGLIRLIGFMGLTGLTGFMEFMGFKRLMRLTSPSIPPFIFNNLIYRTNPNCISSSCANQPENLKLLYYPR